MDDDVVPQCAAMRRREAPNLLVPSTSDNEQAGGLPAQLEPVLHRFVSPPPGPPPSPMPPNYFGVPTVVDFENPTVNKLLGSGQQIKKVMGGDGRPILQMISASDPCPIGSDGFSNLMDAIFSFVFIASNQELPDLLIPSYSTYRPFGAVWLLIFVVINFIVLSVVLATVFSEYKKTFERNTVRRFKNRALCLFEAYDELVAEQTSNGRCYMPADTSAAAAAVTGVTKEQFNSLFAELNRSVTVRYVTPTHLRYLFDTLDDDSNGLLDRNEFVDLVDALNFNYSSVRKQSYAERKMPWLWAALCGASLKAWAVSRSWLSLRVFMIAVMLLNTAAIITETVMDQYYWAEHERFFWTFAWLYFSFSMFYLAEIAIELLTQPWYPYFVLEHRLLELCISLGVSVISILWVLPFVNVPAEWMRYANILRVLKLAEVLYQLSDDFQFVFTSLLAIGRGSITVLCQLFLWTSLFVVVSVQLFGGAVYETNPRLRGMDYAESYEEVLNFNDFAMGFLPFVVTLVGGGPDQSLILGIGAAADRPIASKVVFLAYYYTGHLIFLNVFISFVLNGYELHADARGIYKDGLDALQQEQLKSLEDSLKDADPDWEVKVGSTQGEDVLLRRMFADAVQEAVSEASYHQLQSPVGSRAQRQRAVSNANRKTLRASVPFSRPGAASRRSGPASATPAMQSPYAREMHL